MKTLTHLPPWAPDRFGREDGETYYEWIIGLDVFRFWDSRILESRLVNATFGRGAKHTFLRVDI